MSTITITKRKYQDLVATKFRYEYLREIFNTDILSQPPVKNVKEVIKEFKQTKLYNASFLKSLEKGLNRSNYFKK